MAQARRINALYPDRWAWRFRRFFHGTNGLLCLRWGRRMAGKKNRVASLSRLTQTFPRRGGFGGQGLAPPLEGGRHRAAGMRTDGGRFPGGRDSSESHPIAVRGVGTAFFDRDGDFEGCNQCSVKSRSDHEEERSRGEHIRSLDRFLGPLRPGYPRRKEGHGPGVHRPILASPSRLRPDPA